MFSVYFITLLFFVTVLVRLSRFGLLSPVFLISLHLFLGIVIRFGYLKYIDQEDALIYFLPVSFGSYFEMLAFYILFLMFFAIFSSMGLAKFTVKKIGTCGSLDDNKLLIFLTFFMLVLYLVSISHSAGGFLNYIKLAQNRVSDNVQGLAYIGVLFDLTVSGSLLLLTIKKPNDKLKWLVFLLVLTVLSLFILKGGRGNFLQYIISLLVINEFLSNKKMKFDMRVVIICCLFVVMTTFGLAARYSSQNDVEFNEAVSDVSQDVTKALMSPFSLFDHYELAKEYSKINGYDYGLFYASQLVRPVPRSIWEDKPLVLGKKIRDEFWGDTTGGVPAGYIGESYISFYYFGFFVMSAFLAYVALLLTRWYLCSSGNRIYVFYLSVIVPYVFFNLLRTGVDTGFTRILIYLVTAYLFVSLLNKRFVFR